MARLAKVDLDQIIRVGGGFDLERFVHGYRDVEMYDEWKRSFRLICTVTLWMP